MMTHILLCRLHHLDALNDNAVSFFVSTSLHIQAKNNHLHFSHACKLSFSQYPHAPTKIINEFSDAFNLILKPQKSQQKKICGTTDSDRP